MKKLLLWMAVVFSVLMHGEAPSVYQHTLLQRELATLNDRGVTYRMLAGNQLEVIDPRSGQQWAFDVDRVLTPRKPAYDTIPTLSVDLRTIDTSLYNWRFHVANTIPLTGAWGFPLQVGDLNRNNRSEAYGVYQTQAIYVARAYEQDALGQWLYKFQYPENSGRVDTQADIDRNGLFEVYFRYGDSLFVYEQTTLDSLPKAVKFRHQQWYGNATGIPNQIDFMTGDTLHEIVYRGAEVVTSEEGVYVVRYDSSLNNLRRVWHIHLPVGCSGEGCPWAIATGDFDGDNKKEFATSRLAGDVYVIEHVAEDSFAVTWSTALSVAGRAAAGDVDGNGLTEFFIGGTQVEPDGYVHLRAYAFERTGDNSYQPTFAFNIFPAGIFFVDLYQTADVDGDGVPELLLSFAGGIAIIKGSGAHNYQLFYYKSVSSLDGVAAWKAQGDSYADLFVSRSIGSQQVISQTDVYRLDSSLIADVNQQGELPATVQLFQNYPNPFNPSTTISYELPSTAKVTLKVFDVLGREVATLVDEIVRAGHHDETLNAATLSSGVYFYRLTAGSFIQTRKLLLLK